MIKLAKKYQVWTSDSGSWNLSEVDTLEEAVMMQKYSDFYITKRVDVQITDGSENLLYTTKDNSIKMIPC